MTIRRLARAGTILALAALLSPAACGSSSSSGGAEDTFCTAAGSAQTTCKTQVDCDAKLTDACAKLGDVVQQSALDKARDCLESGVCGAASCVARQQANGAVTDSHAKLATDYCRSCAPSTADCTSGFYTRGKKLPGLLVIAYAPAVVDVIDAKCTGSPGCAARFAQCATSTATQAIGDALDPDTAACLVQGFAKDQGGGPGGPGGKPDVAKCTVDNCAGCCRDDSCLKGADVNACGKYAAGCAVCSGAQQCTASGVCKEPCGPNNCAGCCNGDTCEAGGADAKCGGGGAACKACDAGLTCSNKTCIDASCRATCVNGCCSATGCQSGMSASACGLGGEACVDCGYGRACSVGACVLDPASLWDFYVSFAVVPDKNAQGKTWNFDGQPDPYLIAYSSEGSSTHSGHTTTKKDTTVPFWQETPITGVRASELRANLSFEVWNEGLFIDDFIGGCAVAPEASIFDGSLQDITCPATASGVSVKLYFRINPHP